MKVEDVNLGEMKVYNPSPKGVGDVRLPKSSADHKFIDTETAEAMEEWFDRRVNMLDELGIDDDEG